MTDDEILILVLLALLVWSQRQPTGTVTATIYGADVADDVDVLDGDTIGIWHEL